MGNTRRGRVSTLGSAKCLHLGTLGLWAWSLFVWSQVLGDLGQVGAAGEYVLRMARVASERLFLAQFFAVSENWRPWGGLPLVGLTAV